MEAARATGEDPGEHGAKEADADRFAQPAAPQRQEFDPLSHPPPAARTSQSLPGYAT